MESEMIQALQTIADNIQATSQPGWVECLSIVISSISVVVSGIAIWFAIRVPKQIAEQQNKIALFERRYDCFQFFEECFILYKKTIDGAENEKIEKQCCHMLGVCEIKDVTKEIVEKRTGEIEYVLHQMEFLFEGMCESDVARLYKSLIAYMATIVNQEKTDKAKDDYIKVMTEFLKKYTNVIWDSVTISNIK